MAEAKRKTLAEVVAALKKKNPDLRIGSLSAVAEEVSAISTGNLAIDQITGVGGIPLGRSVELYGAPSCGKTTTALQAAASLQQVIKSGGDPARGIRGDDVIGYFDFEQALDPAYALSLGLDTGHESFVFMQPNSMEEGGDVLRALVESGQLRLAIVDSVASMNTERALEAVTGANALAMHQARVLSDLLKTLNILLRQHNCSVIWLNQIRHVIAMGGRPGMPPATTTPGGDALKFYASLRIEYRQIRQITVEVQDLLTGELVQRPNAARVRVRVTKNKCAPPFAEAEVLTRFGKGFDNFWSAVQVLLAAGLISAPAGTGYFYFDKGAYAHPDMQVGGGGKKVRPYVRTEERLLRFADTHPEWRGQLIELATTTLADRVAGVLAAPTVDIEENPEEQSVSVQVARKKSLPSLVGPGELDADALTADD